VSAVVSYNEALKERTRRALAADLADTQNQSGIALQTGAVQREK